MIDTNKNTYMVRVESDSMQQLDLVRAESQLEAITNVMMYTPHSDSDVTVYVERLDSLSVHELMYTIKRLITDDYKIKAIKLCRYMMDVPLRLAKSIVDTIDDDMRNYKQD